MTKYLLITFFLTFSLASQAQLTSSNSNWNVQTDSLTQQSTLWLTITFDDISNLGGVQISAYDMGSSEFLTEFSHTRTELISSEFLGSESLQFPFFEADPERQYRIQVNAYNLDGTYIALEELITTL